MDQGSSKPEPDGVRDSAPGTYAGHDGVPPTDPVAFAPRCLSIDLEVGRDDGRIHRFAAVRGDTGESFHFRGGHLHAGLAKLDRLADGAAFVVGHNLIDFDAKYLAAADPNLRLLRLPQVDTLRLNPLAFPRNPYHHLVKHYQDGQLKHGSRNDPELDARLTLGVFRDQHQALRVAERRDARPRSGLSLADDRRRQSPRDWMPSLRRCVTGRDRRRRRRPRRSGTR